MTIIGRSLRRTASMNNVVTIRRHKKQTFPDLWPSATFESMVHAVSRNQPADRAPVKAYHFILKADIPSPVCSVIVQPNNTVLYHPPKTGGESFTRWFNKYSTDLRELSEQGFAGTIVGKMGKMGEEDFFCVYYIVASEGVYLDEPNIVKRLRLKDGLFEDSIIPMSSGKLATVTVDKTQNTITTKDITPPDFNGRVVGFPVTEVNPRLSEFGDESALPEILTTEVHMRYMGFLLQGGARV